MPILFFMGVGIFPRNGCELRAHSRPPCCAAKVCRSALQRVALDLLNQPLIYGVAHNPCCIFLREICTIQQVAVLTRPGSDLFSRALVSIFCPLCWPPSKSALFCRAKGTAQILEMGTFRMDLSTKFGKEIPSRNLREEGSLGGARVTQKLLKSDSKVTFRPF